MKWQLFKKQLYFLCTDTVLCVWYESGTVFVWNTTCDYSSWMLSMVSDVCLSWWWVRKGTDMTGQQRAWIQLALEVGRTHNEGSVEKGEFKVAGFWGQRCVRMPSVICFKEIWSWEHLSERTAKNWALLYLELPTNQWFCSIYMEESYHIMQV